MARKAFVLALVLFLPATATDSCDDDSQLLQQSASSPSGLEPENVLDHVELAQKLLDLKIACRNASHDCLPLMRSVRDLVWPRVNALTGLPKQNAPVEVTAFRPDVVHAELSEKCKDLQHTMGYVHVWKSAGFACMKNLKKISRSFRRFRNNATFCELLDKPNKDQRSLFTFVRDPLERFISGYAQIEWLTDNSWIPPFWLYEFQEGKSRAQSFLERFFRDGIHLNGHVRSQLDFLAPSELGCPMKFDFIGKVENLPTAWNDFMVSRGCKTARSWEDEAGRHPTEVSKQSALELGGATSLQTQVTTSASASMHQALRSNSSSFLRAFCWMSLPDYVALEYQMPSECLEPDPDLRRIISLTESADSAGRLDPKVVGKRTRLALPQMGAVVEKTKEAAPPKIFLGVVSAYAERRKRWRKDWKCGQQLTEAGIPYKFVVGWPVDKTRNLTVKHQGATATSSEVKAALQLRNESQTYHDMHFVNLPDTYLSLQAKTFALLDYGYSQGAKYVMKMDDDTCVNGTKLLASIALHEEKAEKAKQNQSGPLELYAGSYRFKGTEYGGQRGRDGTRHPYFSGPCYMLSKDLIRTIVQDDEMNTILWANYGSFDEDAQTGRWVAFAEEHNQVKVDWMKMEKIMIWKNGKKVVDGKVVNGTVKLHQNASGAKGSQGGRKERRPHERPLLSRWVGKTVGRRTHM